MALLPEDMSVDIKAAIDELESAVTEMESRLESTRAERDGARARQVELEIENADMRAPEAGLAGRLAVQRAGAAPHSRSPGCAKVCGGPTSAARPSRPTLHGSA